MVSFGKVLALATFALSAVAFPHMQKRRDTQCMMTILNQAKSSLEAPIQIMST
jgi:hypothetical protein